MPGSALNGIYGIARSVLGLGLGFYFRRIERFHAERVPAVGPVLFTSNHPNSLTDSFVVGASVPRKVNFVATVQLFRFAPLKWFLTRCGVIPINRVKDDPRSMRTVADTFEACFRVLEAGEAVGIFPEGITYDDDQLKELKSGAARMALELEHRHGGKLGLKIVPVGLTYSAKEVYRSDVLANFGEPILAAHFLDGYKQRRKECIACLTAEIESRLKSLILHLPDLEHGRVIEGIKRLYFDRLRLGNTVVHEPVSPRAEELLLTQRIIEVVEHVFEKEPERAEVFTTKLALYERGLKRLKLADEQIFPDHREPPRPMGEAHSNHEHGARGPGSQAGRAGSQARRLHHYFSGHGKSLAKSFGWTVLLVLGAPIALYGWAHRVIPYAVVRWAAQRFTEPAKRKAQASTATIAAGIVAFVLCFGVYILAFHNLFGWPASFWYALSLPMASLLAHYYLSELRRLWRCLRTTVVLLRAPGAARRLLILRQELIAEIESARGEIIAGREKVEQ
jgi:1-acyl-sn-glycerol-3-phosphate acyltransferase